MKIAIIGAGPMGCIFGALLYAGGGVVLVDGWDAHVSAMREKGPRFSAFRRSMSKPSMPSPWRFRRRPTVSP